LLTDPILRSQVDSLWNTFWTGGLTNPLDAIEQFSYLLFMKRLDEEESRRERHAKMQGQPFEPLIEEDLRWRTWSQLSGEKMLPHVQSKVFPYLRTMGGEVADSSFARYMEKAEFKINKASMLVEAVKKIEAMKISEQNQDVQGDLYEYMLSFLQQAGRNGQFRTPRHIIRMMVRMIDPKPNERIGDLAAGTGGFPVNAFQHILEQATSEEVRKYDEKGEVVNPIGDLLTQEQREFLQNRAFRCYDNDSGMTMLRIGSMNLILHGLVRPQFYYADTLSKSFVEEKDYEVLLMNPPFKGAVDKDDIHTKLTAANTTKSELLFIHRVLLALEMGGRAAVIVPDGVLFGSSNAHVNTRKLLLNENRLDGVVSMPTGVFRPYAGVSTAVLLFTRGGRTEGNVWFYEMAYDGFSLDDKRTPTPNQNDIPDILECWHNRRNTQYLQEREAHLAQLHQRIKPLHKRRIELEGEVHRLKFEMGIAEHDNEEPRKALEQTQALLNQLRNELHPLKDEIDSLSRFFWVDADAIRANKYDLSASRYREVQPDEVFYEAPRITIERIKTLERIISEGMDSILEMME
jgi:type I restriction enzyme M protein